MLFKYRIKLELEVEFEAPLLGVDATKQKRKLADSIAKKTLQEVLVTKINAQHLDRDIDFENLKGSVEVLKELSKSEKNKY
jgi:hypothetical protein